MDIEKIVDYSEQAMNLLWEFGSRIVMAIVILVVGLMIVDLLTKTFGKVLDKRGADPSLTPFLKSILSIIGAAGLAIGLALQGTLQNFAGGMILLLLKPFKVGDFIDAVGHMGTVKEIQIFNTFVKTGDNKIIIIPNGQLANSTLTNYSTETTRRVDWPFGIGYGDNV